MNTAKDKTITRLRVMLEREKMNNHDTRKKLNSVLKEAATMEDRFERLQRESQGHKKLTEEFQEYISHINKWWEHKEKSKANHEDSSTKEEVEAWQAIQKKETQIIERLKARPYSPHHITYDQRVYEINYTDMRINYIYAPTTEMLDRFLCQPANPPSTENDT